MAKDYKKFSVKETKKLTIEGTFCGFDDNSIAIKTEDGNDELFNLSEIMEKFNGEYVKICIMTNKESVEV